LVGEEALATQRACRCVGPARASLYRHPADKAKRDTPVVDVLNQIVAKHGRWGFELCFYGMGNHGYNWNHMRVWRVYKEMGLNLPRYTKRRLPDVPRIPLVTLKAKNVIWVPDFMHDTLYYGSPFRTLNMIEKSNREETGRLRCPIIPKECHHNAHMYYVLLRLLEERTALILRLKEQGVATEFHYVPLHSSIAGQKYGRVSGDMRNTDDLSERLLRLPVWVGMTEGQQAAVVNICGNEIL
jgi:hypothetical protein